ncbi:MAG TPA: hypothetical protein VHM89_00845 [Acidimicrobiales bacterium]|nr:hypothetical protein [Acidimicrobiales bacterium]
MADPQYIVAVRRSQRTVAPEDWLDQLRSTEGISVVGEMSGRAQISAAGDAVERLRAELGAFLHIEPLIEHLAQQPQDPPPPQTPDPPPPRL